MNRIVGKRQIILAALVLALGAAVYLNWEYAKLDSEITPTIGNRESEESETKNYGDTRLVGADDDGYGEAYFAQAQLSRTRSRDEAVETLSVLLKDATLDNVQRTELALKAAELAESIEIEGKIENLIKSKGFADCMVYYDTERVDVIVKTSGLTEAEVMQMRDIIVRESGITSIENISIVEVG